MQKQSGKASPLPKRLKTLFWDVNFSKLTWQHDHDYIIGRILSHGDWETIEFLRCQVSDAAIKKWILRRRGRGLDNKQVRFWEAILGLERRTVNGWLMRNNQNPWYNRLHG